MTKVTVIGTFEDLSKKNKDILDDNIRLAAIRNEMLEVLLTKENKKSDLTFPERVRMISDYVESHYLRQYMDLLCVLEAPTP